MQLPIPTLPHSNRSFALSKAGGFTFGQRTVMHTLLDSPMLIALPMVYPSVTRDLGHRHRRNHQHEEEKCFQIFHRGRGDVRISGQFNSVPGPC